MPLPAQALWNWRHQFCVPRVSKAVACWCAYDFEGNDSNNLVVPLEAGRYTAYSAARGTLALDEAALLSARTTGGTELGFHPSMPEMREFFNMKRLAVVAT